jgi:hypothetical protein
LPVKLSNAGGHDFTIHATFGIGVIDNVPTADELRTVSLRLYFKAWAEITNIVTEWMEYSSFPTPEWLPDKGHFYVIGEAAGGHDAFAEWHSYIEAAQNDLQGIYTLIQQSQEIGLKARICEVSPFLLLKRADLKRPTPQTTRGISPIFRR